MSGSVSGRTDRLATLVIGISSAVLAVWVVAAVLMSNHGFDLTDEGYYVLSYRWWDSTPRTVSGVQFIYGPLFQLFGYDVRALRIIRLVSIVGTHAVFAWAFVTWLRTTEQGASLSRAWCWAWGLAIVASGGIAYGRLPLSPGYNDVSLLASLLLVAAVLRVLVGVRSPRRALPVGPALAIPPLVAMMVLSKWASAFVAVGFIGVLAAGAVRASGPRPRLRTFILALVASTLMSALAANAAMGGFTSAIGPMVRVNRLVAAQTNSPLSLVRMYLVTGTELTVLVASLCFVPVLGIAVSVLLRRVGAARWANGVLIFAPVTVVGMSYLYLGGHGVREEVLRYTTSLVGLSVLTAGGVVIGLSRNSSDRARPMDGARWVVVLLAGLPVVETVGTGNAVFALAVNQFAAWAALLVLAGVRLQTGPARLFVNVASMCAVVVAGVAGGVGLVTHPYRTRPLDESSSTIGGPGPASQLHVSPGEADRLKAVRAALGGLATEGRPMLAFDELPGLIVSLDGRSVGESWYSASDRQRSAANITDACANGNPWGDRQPIIFYNRLPSTEEVTALRGCHIDLSQDYHRVPVNGFKPALTIYIPDPRKP